MTLAAAAVSDLQTIELLPSDAGNLAGTDTGREALSHSTLNLFLACARKFEFAKVHRLELVEQRRPLGMGRAYQKAIELQDLDAALTELRAATRVLSPEDEEKLQVEEAIVTNAAKLYMDRWPATEGTREYEYRVRLRNPWTGAYSRTFDLHGFADELIDNESHSYVELIENKLVGQLTGVSIKKLKLDRQISLACYGIWRATGKRVARVHYRFMRRPQIRRRQKETHLEFVARIEQDYAERPDHYAHEESLFRDDADLLRVEAELWQWAEAVRSARRDRIYPRNTTHCADWGGCEFLPICAGDEDAIHLYQERPERTQTPEETA